MAMAEGGWIAAAAAGLPSASALARAASTAAMKASRAPRVSRTRHRRLGRAAGRGDDPAQLRGRIGRGGGERGRAGDGLLGEPARHAPEQGPSAAGLVQRLEREERRRPGPSPTARSPRRAAASSPTQISSPVGASRADGVGAVLVADRRAREQPGDALADQRRRVRHRAHDALAAGRRRRSRRCACRP